MKKTFRVVIVVFGVALACWGQNYFATEGKSKQHFPAAEADRLYLSACSAVQAEFRTTGIIRPNFTLVLGAEKNEVQFKTRQIRLTHWDPYLFTEGVVIFASEDLMTAKERMVMTRRAISWADATVSVAMVSK